MTGEFTGKAVLVTGAASGLGRATALDFARGGADLLLVDLDAAGLEKTREAAPGDARIETFACDVSDPDRCVAAVEAALTAFGRLDVLCNVAGIVDFAHFRDVTPARWQRIFAVNVHAPFYLCQAAMPHLIAARGAIVNVASSAALMGHAYMAAYTSSKAALASMTQSLAMEFIKEPVRINAVAPGGMTTAMTAAPAFPPDADMALIARFVPIRGSAAPEQVAEMILFLASDRGLAVHGAVISVDGGLTTG